MRAIRDLRSRLNRHGRSLAFHAVGFSLLGVITLFFATVGRRMDSQEISWIGVMFSIPWWVLGLGYSVAAIREKLGKEPGLVPPKDIF